MESQGHATHKLIKYALLAYPGTTRNKSAENCPGRLIIIPIAHDRKWLRDNPSINLTEFDKSENYNNEINALGNRVFFWGMNEFLLPPKLYQHNCPK